MVTGIILGINLMLLYGAYITRYVKNNRWKAQWNTIHKIFGFLFVILSILHMILTFKLFRQRPMSMYVIGIIMVLSGLFGIYTYYGRKQMKKRWLTYHKIAAFIILICLIIHVSFGLSSLRQYKESVRRINIVEIDLHNISDGEYIGECNVGYIYAKVKVQVADHQLDSIELLEHQNEHGTLAEQVVDEMIKQQANKVDAISGATNSSMVIMRAVEHALLGVSR